MPSEVVGNSTKGCLRLMQPLNLGTLTPDRNALLVLLLGNLFSLKKGQQDFSANLEGSHTDQSFFQNKCGILPGAQKTHEGGKGFKIQNTRGREHLRETAWICQEVAGDASMEKGLVGSFLLIIQFVQKMPTPGGYSLLQDKWLGDSASLV